MYVLPKLVASKATCENAKPVQFSDERYGPSCSSLRGWLLFWASLRLAVSVLWTGVLATMTYQSIYYYYWYQFESMYVAEAPNLLTFGVVAVALQLVEIGMIVLFIVAGIKKSAVLYQAYYYYCIVTFIIYIIAVNLCLSLSYEDGHYFGEIYLTYHINDFPILEDDNMVFGVAAMLDICMEILLIKLVKKMMDKYSQVEVKNTCERV